MVFLEFKFEQTTVPFLQTIAGQMQSQEQTQQIRLADTMPDVKRIVSAWGQVIIRGKQWLGGSVQISGGVIVRVLYQGEADDKMQCVETWLPFQMEWDIPAQEQDGSITALPFLRSVDARALSDRKIMARATVGILMQATVPAEAACYAECELPEDVQVLRRTYLLQLPVEQGEKLVNIEETLVPPVTNFSMLRCNILPSVSESRIVSDKLVMRGNVLFDMLLMDSNGKICKWQPEMPFSQFAQLNREYDPQSFSDISFAVTELETEQKDSGETRLKCSVLAQYTIYDRQTICVVEDAYSVGRSLEMKTHQMTVSSLLKDQKQPLQLTSNVQLEGHQILDVNILMDDLQIRPNGRILNIAPAGAFQVLLEDVEGNLVSSVSKWDSVLEMENDSDAEVFVSSEQDGMPAIIGNSLSQQLLMNIKSVSGKPITMVSELTLGEENKPDSNRPSLILRAMEGDELWDLAKSSGSTVEAIMKANGLKSDPQPGQMLLIPIS